MGRDRGIYNSGGSGGGGGGTGNARFIEPFDTTESAGPYDLNDLETGDPISGTAYQITVANVPADFTGTDSITLAYIPESGLEVKGTYIPT